ncbi:DTW domain-containing protein [Simiduia sp. 21SJ11W-1]|uniref:DTW domain-containing protein n=1 Tax=Simiduia sp. 21SJ11W-1 TaxID=2909669 RepID=UPI0020A1539F|nr:tRNA-uridine aminocarboxypropyltransferase [Simiduia sp. 21SJ11W-1]UTA47018.1 DTW domain-containing protein [Simiduia sp. 21SJ11W-1]
MLEFILLCHERELAKKSNTGQLLMHFPAIRARQIIWARKAPDAALLTAIARQECWLVYPLLGMQGEAFDCVPESLQREPLENQLRARLGGPVKVILMDATWQQAQKMVNHSPYLADVPRLALVREGPSLFRLRRNQRPGGLCTVECAIELLFLAGQPQEARALHARFMEFMAQPRNLP